MRKGRLSGRTLALSGTVVSLATLVAACYQSIWKADYSSTVNQARNYSVTSTVDSAGNLLVGGSSTVAITQDNAGNPIVHFQPTLLKYSPSGALLWEFNFDNGRRRSTAQPVSNDFMGEYTGGGEISQIVLDTQGNIFAAGIVPGANYASDAADYDLAVFKLDAGGTLQWQRVIERPSQDSPLALGIGNAGQLLLGVGHVTDLFSSSAEALALSAADGHILWNHEEADARDRSFLFGFRENTLVQQATAAIAPTRIAIGHDYNRVRVYDDAGNLLYRLPANSTTTNTGPEPDMGVACSGDGGGIDINLALAFVGEDLLAAQSYSVAFCTAVLSSLSLIQYDNAGMQVWHKELPEKLAGEGHEDYEAWQQGERDFFVPFSAHMLYQDAKLKADGQNIYLTVNSNVAHVSPRLCLDCTTNTVDAQIYALNSDGNLRWHQHFYSTPIIQYDSVNDEIENVVATWTSARDITITAQGNPVIALNELEAHGVTYYYGNLAAATLHGASSRLVEFDAMTGKKDSFGTEKDQLVRSVAAANGKGVFKVGDNHPYMPAWWMLNPSGVTSTPSTIHISHYRPR